MSKDLLKKSQNPTLHNQGVIWKISKVTKIRDQGMEIECFVDVCIYVFVVWV